MEIQNIVWIGDDTSGCEPESGPGDSIPRIAGTTHWRAYCLVELTNASRPS